MTADPIDQALSALRREQSEAVMPLIGPMLDELDGLPNDTRGELEELAPELFEALAAIQATMEGERDDYENMPESV